MNSDRYCVKKDGLQNTELYEVQQEQELKLSAPAVLPPQTNHPINHLATSLCFAAVAAAAAWLKSLPHGSRQEA